MTTFSAGEFMHNTNPHLLVGVNTVSLSATWCVLHCAIAISVIAIMHNYNNPRMWEKRFLFMLTCPNIPLHAEPWLEGKCMFTW